MDLTLSDVDIQAVLVDMEEGVVSEVMNGPLCDVFDHRQLITDVSGSGNNWSFILITVVLLSQCMCKKLAHTRLPSVGFWS